MKRTLTILLINALPLYLLAQELLISEVLYAPAVGNSEWIEIYNPSCTTLALDNFCVGDEESSGGFEGMDCFPSGFSFSGKSVVIVAKDGADFSAAYGFLADFVISDPSSTEPLMTDFPTWASGTTALGNSGDEIVILKHDGSNNNIQVVDGIAYGSSTSFVINGTTIIDAALPDIANTHSLVRTNPNIDNNLAADWSDQFTPDPGITSNTMMCSNCPSDYANANKLTGTESDDVDYETDGIIESNQLIDADVSYNSGSCIDLQIGFEVNSGKEFHAFIDGCNN